MLTKKEKENIIKKFRVHESDTGSSHIQTAILSKEIEKVSKHLKLHKKDHASRKGLLHMVNKRRKLLNYMLKTSYKQYKKLATKLKLKVQPEPVKVTEET